MDEVRISSIARSASWIQTSYNNEKAPRSFCAVETEETLPDEPLILNPSPSNGLGNVPVSLDALSFNLINYRGKLMDYTVTTFPNIGTGQGSSVPSGQRCTVTIGGLMRSYTYTWCVSVTYAGSSSVFSSKFSFTTYVGRPPTQGMPLLVSSGGTNTTSGNLICYNKTTSDWDGDQIVNIYNWYTNNVSRTNLLLPFDLQNSSTVEDYSGYGNNGKIIGNVNWTSDGRVGGCYQFDGGYIKINGSDTLDGGGRWTELTVEHWIYLTENQNNGRTIAKIPSYEIRIGSSNQVSAGIWTNNYYSVYSSKSLSLNRWYYVAFTYKSGGNLTLYIDGLKSGSKNVAGSIETSGTLPLSIGWFDFFKGKIDEVKIFPQQLTPQQIYQDYLEGKGGLSSNATIVKTELRGGDIWTCRVTPIDRYQDGISRSSNPIVVLSANQGSSFLGLFLSADSPEPIQCIDIKIRY
jgi:hypothetical protein